LTTNPIPIPTNDGGLSGSFWVTHCINITSTPSSYVKNLKWYITMTSSNIGADWNLGTNGDLMIGVSSAAAADTKTWSQGFSSSSYNQASGTTGTFGYFLSSASNGHSYYRDIASALSGGAASTKTYNSLANAYMVQSGSVMDNPGTGRSNFIATQVWVASGATQGDKPDKTATFVYSEV